jgi:hypothetical protein
MPVIIALLGLLAVGMLIFTYINENKQKKLALAEKPTDNRIYKVFRMEIDGNHYYVVKYYCLHTYPSYRAEWALYGNFTDYKTMTRTQAIELCDRLNDSHLEDLHKRKMTRLMQKDDGTIIH